MFQSHQVSQASACAQDSHTLADTIGRCLQPIAVLLTSTRWVLLALLLATVPHLIDTAFVLHNVLTSFASQKFSHFRFTPTHAADASVASPVVEDFHLLYNGCLNDIGNVTIHRDGSALIKTYPVPLAFNGWLVRMQAQTDGSSSALADDALENNAEQEQEGLAESGRRSDAVSAETGSSTAGGQNGAAWRVPFKLEGSRDGSEWSRVASSRWRHSARLSVMLKVP